MLTIAFERRLLRLRHLRCNALIEQRLPGGNHLRRHLFIHRARGDSFHLCQLFTHVIQRLLSRSQVRRAARRFNFHCPAQAGDETEILIVALAQHRHLPDQQAVNVITIRNTRQRPGAVKPHACPHDTKDPQYRQHDETDGEITKHLH